MEKRINVTKTFLPPIEEYNSYIEKIWANNQLTNQGPLLKEFEEKISEYLGVNSLHFVANGTLALQLALRALDIKEGEVITTPFSYVATTSAILWERCQPVYVDIEPDTLCIDPGKIESAITEKTKAILAVHVFGNTCNIEAIEKIAKKHNLKVIYDGAHAFGVKYKGKQLLNYGDVSICSFHSTKPFHTIEGGCVVTHDKEVSDRLELLKRFGHNWDEHYMLGINAKASEFHAAMGLCNLKYFSSNINKRKKITEVYNLELDRNAKGIELRQDTEYNYSYYPVILESEDELMKIKGNLEQENIFPRRYFYPSLNKLPYLKATQSCLVSEGIASRILCLPLYESLDIETVKKICRIINK